MPEIQKVTDPAKIVTDEPFLKRLAGWGIDKDHVEFFQDYAPRSLGKEHSPYAKFYRDLKSGKKFMVVSGLPMVKPDGVKIEAGWLYTEGKYYSKTNLFSAIVVGKQIQLSWLDDIIVWKPQLFVGGSEIVSGEQPALLSTDPVNEHYQENTLEWAYGDVCKRRLRVIEGRISESWIFESDPKGEVRVKHNFVGSLQMKLGYAKDADGKQIPVSVVSDQEIISAAELVNAAYPIELGASPETFYAGTADGSCQRFATEDWLTIRNSDTGTQKSDTVDSDGTRVMYFTPNRAIKRLFFPFDTSGLPNDAIVTAATFSLRGGGAAGSVEGISAQKGTQAAVLELADYNNFTGNEYGHITSLIFDAYNDIIFGDGLEDISLIGITKICVRDYAHDYSNIENDPDTSLLSSVYMANKGSGYKPRLVVAYEVSVPTTYERNAAVAIGVISTALRNLIEAREASVDVGVAVSALRIKVIIRKAAVAIGIRVWEGFQKYTRNAAVAVGMAISASRTVVYGRSASVAIGVAVSAGRNVARATFAASVAIGIAVSALRLKRVLRVASVAVGIAVSASRALVILREAAVETGITIAAYRKKRVLRKAAVDIGIIATADITAKALSRLATVLVGVTVSASRNLALATKSAAVEVGIAVSATSAKVKIYIASVAIGIAVSAARSLSLAREASVAIGIDVTALRIKVIHKLAPVAIGIAVSALRLKRVLRVASVEVGIAVSASRVLKLAREAVVGIGIAVSALRVKVIHIAALVLIGITAGAQTVTIITKYFRSAAVSIGVAVSASRSIILNRYASTDVGISVSALRIKIRQRWASVAIGVDVSATRIRVIHKAALVAVGIAVSASRSLILGRFASVAVGVTAWATRVWYRRHLVGTLITTQYRNVQMITAQYRLVQVITAMYRKVKLIIS